MSHRYIFALLDHLGISSFLSNSVKRIYKNSYAFIVINRVMSEIKIIIKTGIKQGCALSMFLYTLGIEELLVRISLNKNIIGFPIKVASNLPIEIKSTAYADDTAGILKNLESIDFFFEEFKDWGKVSGACVNEVKLIGISLLLHSSEW